ncbi:MAG TPA: FtsW/RodA/SpoVE family cell cycle protein, partial [Actinomycetota bacterium]|nr:FtsW/RodA/SpoVE family cell cycle protein [Actinomycetota bacterium]
MSRAAVRPSRAPLSSSIGFTVVALVLAVGAYVIAGFGKRGQLPATFVLYVTIFVAGYVGALIVTRWLAPAADPALFPTAGVLVGLGFAMIFRLSGDLAAEQATWIVVGLLAYSITLLLVRDHRMLDAYTYTIGLVGLILLMLPMVPGIGREINGARLWVQIGDLGFQPAEIGKVLIVIFLASYLTQRRELLRVATTRIGPLRLPPAKHVAPVLLAWAGSLAILFVQRDLGASLLYFGIFVVMLWVATGRVAYLIFGLVLFAAGAYAGWVLFDHVQLRVDIWLNALDPNKVHGVGYGQLAQAWFGMATGGLVGSGLGLGSPG